MSEAFAALAALEWLEPWAAVSKDRAASLEQALMRELPEGHALQGRAAQAIAASTDTEDVLFVVQDPNVLAVVHLAYGKAGSEGPFCMSFDSVEAFVEGCMQPDHLEHVDSDV